MESVLQYQFFQNALWASLLSAIVCGIVGAYIVVRRIVFVSGGITHASFGGLGLGLYLGINPILSACLVAVLSAVGIGRLSRRDMVREDSAIAGVWALGMALGVLFMTLTPGYTSGLSSYLFGNILLVSREDLWALALFALILVFVFVRYYRQILYSMFDADFAQTRGLRADRWNLSMLILVSIALVLSIRLVGIMLLMSLLTLPQSTIGLFTSRFRTIVLGSILLILVANVLGLVLSYYLSIPSGVIIVLLLFGMMGLGRLIRSLSKR
ncbi:metal ABC transporter permease [Porphyromonas sp. COT-239 OH1446]|uniref:metal ABC transporter permease n=1 Tax=Porphyromonas sp. COT-239 OH1446 TaxID=1515613 RepID=UPI00052DFD40|nr:metal ABC transporter permease [Porphyromonas sp. COT-239 OH1446]KGN72134.1 hypothetical protein HQ37_00530 [Porphyromonas sp. COT-239 OH1446]